MPARAIASGTIAFGLVSIPVKLYTATSSRDVRFHMLHSSDGGRLRQRYECRQCEQTVERSETARGYEYARDQFVVLTDEELKAFERQSDQCVEIEQFVPIAQVDPVFFERSNYLGPDKGGSRPYHLLREAMWESGRVAIGRFHARGRQPLVLIRATTEGLVLHRLYYADEVRGFADIDLGERTAVREAEQKLALQLIEQLSQSRFDPTLWQDEYRQQLLDAIDRKVAGEEVVASPAAEPREKIIDLVSALKRSLSEGEPPARKPARRAAPKPPADKPAAKPRASRRKAKGS